MKIDKQIVLATFYIWSSGKNCIAGIRYYDCGEKNKTQWPFLVMGNILVLQMAF